MKKIGIIFLFLLVFGIFRGEAMADASPTSYLDLPLQTTPIPVTPGVQNCDYLAPTETQACRTCILETGGSWTVMGCLPNSPEGFVTVFLKFALRIGGGIAFLAVVYGSFLLLTSAGNPQKINEGKKTVTYAIIGLLVIIFSVFILEFLGVKVLGLPGLQ